ncbi:hypothetical protein JHK85_005431 [Glycine max]|nr:hypothetical protein JHK85_005431 [Glycine max]
MFCSLFCHTFSTRTSQHCENHKFLSRKSFLGSWEASRELKEAKAQLAWLQREYTEQVMGAQEESIREIEAMKMQAYLLGAKVGYDSLFFAQIDYQDKAKRKDVKTFEVMWWGSKSFGSSSQIFFGAFPEKEPPSNFYYEVNDDFPIIQDDVSLFDYNVPKRVKEFVATAISHTNIICTNHIMWTMRIDFKYQYAQTWFQQLDKFIHYVNQDDCVNAYRTKYLTSRPTIKGYVRFMTGYYLTARQLKYFKGKSPLFPKTGSLAEALPSAQHHDAHEYE